MPEPEQKKPTGRKNLDTPRAPKSALDMQAWAEYETEKAEVYALRRVRRRRMAIVGLILLTGGAVAGSAFAYKLAQPVELAEGPAATQMLWVIETLEGDSVSERSVEEHFASSLTADDQTIDLLVEELSRRAAEWSELRILDTGVAQDGAEIWVDLAAESMDTGRVRLTTEPAAPHGILSLTFGPIPD